MTGLISAFILIFIPFFANAAITVDNLEDQETVGHQLLIVRGNISNSVENVSIENASTPEEPMTWPANSGYYKASILLQPCENNIELRATGESVHRITVYWVPLTENEAPNFMRLVYTLPKDHETSDYGLFQAPAFEDNSPESAVKRLQVGGLMMQAAAADLMQRAGQGKRTFRIERDDYGDVKVLTHVSEQTFAQMTSSNSGNDLLGDLKGDELRVYDNWQDANHAITASVTRYIGGPVFPETNCYNDCNNIQVGEAWGGSGGGWVHSANLFSWAETIQEIPDRLSDNRQPEDYDLYPGRTYRDGFWATFALTLGSLLHEAGHGWGVSHPNGNCGLMSSYYENINRIFMTTEPESWGYDGEEVNVCYENSTINRLEGSEHLGTSPDWTSEFENPYITMVNRTPVLSLDQTGNLRYYNIRGQRLQNYAGMKNKRFRAVYHSR